MAAAVCQLVSPAIGYGNQRSSCLALALEQHASSSQSATALLLFCFSSFFSAAILYPNAMQQLADARHAS
jgi:hypothetical protein